MSLNFRNPELRYYHTVICKKMSFFVVVYCFYIFISSLYLFIVDVFLVISSIIIISNIYWGKLILYFLHWIIMKIYLRWIFFILLYDNTESIKIIFAHRYNWGRNKNLFPIIFLKHLSKLNIIYRLSLIKCEHTTKLCSCWPLFPHRITLGFTQ